MKARLTYDNDSISSTELGQKKCELTYFNGSIREVRMYKRILSANEVMNNYNGGCFSNPSDTTGLVLWAPLNDGSGTSCADKSQYHATGTITNPGTGYWGSSSSYCYQNIPVLCETHTKHFANNVVKYSEQSAYRYGFNGKEKDDETYGEGDAYDYGARMYDARLGRFLSVDPLTGKYPMLTPYQFAGNKPLAMVDLDGLEDMPYQLPNGNIVPLNNENAEDIYRQTMRQRNHIESGGLFQSGTPNAGNFNLFQQPTPTIINPYSQLNAQDNAASRIINGGRVEFGSLHPSPLKGFSDNDNANADDNINDAAHGKAAHTSPYSDVGSTDVVLRNDMLAGMEALSKDYTFKVSEITGGDHSTKSRHYIGVAFDVIEINGSPVNKDNIYFKAFMEEARRLGATEVLGPGDPGHDTHVHAAWPRQINNNNKKK